MENPLGRKGLRYLKTCRDNVRKRWLNEYLHALQERFNSRPEARHGTACLKKGSLWLIKDTTKNKAHWKVDCIIYPIVGKDGVTREYKLLTGCGYVIDQRSGWDEKQGTQQRIVWKEKWRTRTRRTEVPATSNWRCVEHCVAVRHTNWFNIGTVLCIYNQASYRFVSQLFFLIWGYNEQWGRLKTNNQLY